MIESEKPENSGSRQGKQLYQINPDYVLRKIGDEYAIIPVGETCAFSNAVMTPNETAVFLWQMFMTPSTEEDAAAKGLMEYEGPAQQIRRDVHNFVVQSLDCGVLMEVKENE